MTVARRSACLRRLAAASVSSAGLVACGSILGIGDVPPLEVREGGTDASLPSLDVAVDAHAHLDARDATPDAMREASAADAMKPAPDAPACNPLPAEAGPSFACSAIEAGTCGPRAFPDAALGPYRPPLHHPGACTPQEVAEWIQVCAYGNLDGDPCSSFNIAHPACSQCIGSAGSDPSYGAVISSSYLLFANEPGCVALLDPCDQPCAAALQESQACQMAACLADCNTTVDGSLDPTQVCFDQAHECVCAGIYGAAANCVELLESGPAAGCFEGSSFTTIVMAYANLFCGAGVLAVPDGGLDGSM